jgi:hypothetical protein
MFTQNAGWVVATMQDLHPLRDRLMAVDQGPRMTMGINVTAIDEHSPVALSRASARPFQTSPSGDDGP